MDAIVNRACYPTFIVNPKAFVDIEGVNKREEVENAIEPTVLALVKELSLKDNLGINSRFLYEKMEAVYNIVEYIYMVRDKVLEDYIRNNEVDSDKIKEELKYDCVRFTMSCRYNLGTLFDEIAEIIRIPDGELGVGYMTINVNTNNNINTVHKIR